MHSPLPWRIVRSETPYYTWLMDAEGGDLRDVRA
jgi:hypothetical protein